MPSKERGYDKRAGKRKDRNQRFGTREPVLGYYLIVTDTEETEKNYFEGLKNSIPENIRSRIVIKVERAKNTYNLIEHTMELLHMQAQQRIPWIVLDRDQVKDFNGIVQTAEKNGINVGWSNPCFEIWMFAYFGEMPNIADSISCCAKFRERFVKVTGKEYRKNDKDIYRKLVQYGDSDEAVRIAERNLTSAKKKGKTPSESYPVCTVHQLVKEILDKVSKER